MISMQRTTIEYWMHLGGLISTQEARVAPCLLRFFRAKQPPACIHNLMVTRCKLEIFLYYPSGYIFALPTYGLSQQF